MQKGKENTEIFAVDERTESSAQEGLAVCGSLAIFYAAGRIIYVGCAKGTLALPELILIIAFALVMWINERKNKVYDFSKFGKKFDTSLTKKGKRSRMKKYFVRNLPFAFFMTVIDIVLPYDSFLNSVYAQAALIFATISIGGFAIDCFFTEQKVKKYNEYMLSLDDDED